MNENVEDIQQAAQNMIDRYGDNALIEADLRILELESRNEQEAAALWLQIRQRVELLLDKSGEDTRH